MKRGPYRAYLSDYRIQKPKSTYYYQENKRKKSSGVQSGTNMVSDIEDIQNAARLAPVTATIDKSPTSPTSGLSCNLDSEVNSLDEQAIVEDFFNTVNESDKPNSKQEIAAAVLNMLYCGNMTQSCIPLQSALVKFLSKTKVPSDFDSLAKLLDANKTAENVYTKTWFCSICITKLDKLENQHQRTCTSCGTR